MTASGVELSVIDHCQSLTDSRSWAYKRAWMDEVSAICARYDRGLAGERILEVGAGVHNPLGSALIALSWGASAAEAVEPSDLEIGHDRSALMCALLESSVASPELVGTRPAIQALLARFGFKDGGPSLETEIPIVHRSIAEIVDAARKYDIVHSNATLEHVQQFDTFLASLWEVSAPGAVHIHKVDFIDHDYYTMVDPQPEDAFKFLLDGGAPANATCNRLRIDDMLASFEAAGFGLVAIHKRWSIPFPSELRPRLQLEWTECSDESLSTIDAVLVHRRRSSHPAPAPKEEVP